MTDPANPPPAYGTTEHAQMIAGHRHHSIRDGLQWLTYGHLPPALQRYSAPFYTAAVDLLSTVGTDGPELTAAISRLVDAKDSGMRAGIRHTTGRAGSVPHPQAQTGTSTRGVPLPREEAIDRALTDVREGGMSARAAALKHGVDPSAVQRRVRAQQGSSPRSQRPNSQAGSST